MASEPNRQSRDTSERDEARRSTRKEPRRPFPAFDFDQLPARADDPPYRPWWVLSDPYEH
jgi:hypothetical protein